MKFSMFFFSADGTTDSKDKYTMMKECARFADQHALTAIWTPERHFDAFGGLYPNPSVTSAALAMITERIKIRAGSIVLPLQDPLRVAEEWAVVDNLSGGRVEVAFASGWHVNDFVLNPAEYENRRQQMFEKIEIVKELWGGQPVYRINGEGKEVPIYVYPRPLQKTLPIWITCQSDETFVKCGEMGANVLTNFSGKRVEDLARKIRLYRRAMIRGGHDPVTGQVALMMHTFVGKDEQTVREKVKKAYGSYLLHNLELQRKHAEEETLSEDEKESLISHAVDRLFQTNGLVGTPSSCVKIVERFKEIGVTEIACLVDFGIEVDEVLESLPLLNQVIENFAKETEVTWV
ncbi:MupA/Atu3671 family FMN-dependent luciferase-like monooxygenase [Brevibacillus borstelensis]|jgi:natural product biosynthesis luciferase-like monooxygenase protein|uniref:MupA/Atu3671 family FMN-dependent luciferase-like monooxygenase n=1 Tax=Brevibacillus borstelensis TaxID=45462 RepID=UPI002E1CF2A2|nr:MupA/Atu3671 family FMN-dependent luciferase-like monooxygenase [Brevibacillus borstelensis]MED1744791.1 LLM class flavin-dependent oxidoreductase [Brevibacillus borstelensis]MED1876333.1 LLM class flavin-dependent oxidoreductase [Brevibacillus borstelensis]